MTAITVNGVTEGNVPSTVAELLRLRGLDPEARGLAVAVNGRVLPRAEWKEKSLAGGDAVEIVKPFSGG